jgi:hypothetical protein
MKEAASRAVRALLACAGLAFLSIAILEMILPGAIRSEPSHVSRLALFPHFAVMGLLGLMLLAPPSFYASKCRGFTIASIVFLLSAPVAATVLNALAYDDALDSALIVIGSVTLLLPALAAIGFIVDAWRTQQRLHS